MLEPRLDRTSARGGEPVRPRRRPDRLEWAILLTAVIAVFSAALMPFAPVSMSTPSVSWPQSPAAPVSTELQLTAELPLSVDASFSCAALAAARDGGDGILLSTVLPGRPSEDQGLLVRMDGDSLFVQSNRTEVYRGTVPAGDCGYQLQMDGASTTLQRDGEVLATTGPALPDVDVLATSVAALPGATADDLDVTVRVDDQFSSSPTAVKWLITAVLVLASLGTLVLLAVWDRRRRAAQQPARTAADDSHRSWWRGVSVVDLGVLLLMLLWLFIAPMTDDDGYYAAMARNSLVDGYVGNYYQLFNQGYTPFTWFYQLLGYWDLLGHSPVVLRIPSLVMGLLTYAVARALVESVGLPAARTWLSRLGRHAVVALLFSMAWLPYSLGVRPESAVALLAVLSLGAVVIARKRLSLAWFAGSLLISGIAITCHPTGVVALAPWLLSIPVMWSLVRTTNLWSTLARAAGLIAPAAFSAVPGFLDGTLNDFMRSAEIFEDSPNAEWYDEVLRYEFLLGNGAMGAYAKRITVLVALVTLLWFAVLQLSSGARRRRAFPPLMALTGWSLALALLLLWITPSKWTHHFGAISGLSTVFLSCVLLYGARAVVSAQRGRSTLAPGVVLAGVSLVLVFALAMHGPNNWAYSWMLGMPHKYEAPFIGGVSLDSPALWLVVVLLAGVGVALRQPRRLRTWGRVGAGAYPVAVVVFLTVGLVYLVGGFALATARTWDGYSPWADAIQDPLGRNGGAQGAIVGPDPATATTLPRATDEGASSTGFTAQGGYHPTSPPTGTADQQPTVWGSYPELGGEENTGQLTTGWFTLPETDAQQRLMVEASGRLGMGNDLVAEYGRTAGDQVTVTGSQPLDDGVDNPAWRQIPLVPGPDAELVRVVATDASAGPGGWLATTAPMVAQLRPLTDVVPADAQVAVSWQISFLFPAADLPATVNGITEPSEYVFAWGEGGLGGLGDNIFTRGRGGLYHPTMRSSSLTQLATELPGQPELTAFRAFQVQNPYADAAYDLDRDREVRWGWEGP